MRSNPSNTDFAQVAADAAGWTVGEPTQATRYVHGYLGTKNARLHDQADTLAELLHSDTGFPGGSAVLEVGCGVGAQTVTVASGLRGRGTAL